MLVGEREGGEGRVKEGVRYYITPFYNACTTVPLVEYSLEDYTHGV